MTSLAAALQQLQQLRSIPITERKRVPITNVSPPTPEMKAEAARYKAQVAADAAKQRAAQQADRLAQENHDIILPNISSFSKEAAIKLKGLVESMIQGHEDAGMNVNGAYGSEKINSLGRYLSAINEHISKGGAPVPDAAASPSSAAAAAYVQVQNIPVGSVRSLSASLSYLAQKVGVATTA
jgi:hypothetical protein